MKDVQANSIKEAWIISLILGFIMINFPFIHIFNSADPVLGIPKIVLYFFIGWPSSIAVIWFFVRSSKDKPLDKQTVTED
ncbi:MAG: hypothetical protein KAU22_09640 [Desulfuromonadales bacterium]|nr:hypothetical protein [Desulfuromonadales bacterium]